MYVDYKNSHSPADGLANLPRWVRAYWGAFGACEALEKEARANMGATQGAAQQATMSKKAAAGFAARGIGVGGR